MATLYLIRHGEPEIRGVFLGQMDPPLSAAGKEQAESLSKLEVPVAYCSPLRRARETALQLRADRLIELANLREIDYGEWTGNTWAEIERTWPGLASRKSADWLGVSAPGGESWANLLARVGSVWRMVRAGCTPAAVVAHQGVNAALASLIDGRDPLHFSQRCGEVISVEYD